MEKETKGNILIIIASINSIVFFTGFVAAILFGLLGNEVASKTCLVIAISSMVIAIVASFLLSIPAIQEKAKEEYKKTIIYWKD